MKTSLKVTLLVTVGIAIIAFFMTIAAGWTPKLGLDLAGGFEATYKPDIAVSSGEMSDHHLDPPEPHRRARRLGCDDQQPGWQRRRPGPRSRQPTAAPEHDPADRRDAVPPRALRGTALHAPREGQAAAERHADLRLAVPAHRDEPQRRHQHSATNGDRRSRSGTRRLPDSATPSSPHGDAASKTVLLETAANTGFGGDRLVLGPAQVAGNQITSAQATFNSPDWVVNLNLSSSGSHDWDTLGDTAVPRLHRDRPRRTGDLRTTHASGPGDLHELRRQGPDLGELHRVDG